MRKADAAHTAKILIVDDEWLVRSFLCDLLEDHGFVTVQARTADEAWDLLQANRDIYGVVTDLEMPGSMRGVDFAHRVGTGESALPVLVISGVYHRAQLSLPPGVEFLAKPLPPQRLVRAVEQMMSA